MLSSVRVALVLPALASLSLGACGKPRYTPTLDRTEGGETGASAACPPTRLSAETYGDVATASVPDEVGSRQCVKNVREKIAAEAACARQFNQNSLAAAFEDAGLRPVERERVSAQAHHAPAAFGEIYQDPESGEQRLIVGWEGGGCSSSTPLAVPASEPALAVDASGALWIVKPSPRGESRGYADCTCFAGCGMAQAQSYLYLTLEPGETVAGSKVLDYDSLSISTDDVDRHHACGYAP